MKYTFFIILFFFITALSAQKTANVILENAEFLTFDKTQSAERQVLKDNVRFRHEGAVMYCDSAYFYSDKNSLDAFGHIKMVQGDTLFVYADALYYDGNVKTAYLRRHVRMVNRDVTLTTDSLNYDRNANVGYYFGGGKITDPKNVLVSQRGYYYPARREAVFRKNVKLTNADSLIITSDTLLYNTQTKIAYLLGQSEIENRDGQIFSELGSYNTNTQYSSLYKHSLVKNKDGKSLTADTIYYDKERGLGRVFGNAEIKDTTQKVILRGDKGYYNEITQESMMTRRAVAVEYSAADSLFLHADTLFHRKDSTFSLLRAFRHVRFFRSDVQGKCDSLVYATRDSLLSMYADPILWSDNNQLTGNLIQAFIRDSVIDYILVKENAMAVMQDIDTTRFNQLIGKDIKGYIRGKELYRIDVSGNTQSIYFPRESDSTLVGVNKSESSFMTIYLKENKVDKVVLYPGATGKMLPDNNLAHEDIFFPTFVWHNAIRPRTPDDIFLKTEPQKKEERRRRNF
ncbi:MAG: hypothetical protein LBN27_04715 [Prevotellaceae bacterium]|jgi:lipopolysaccharide export system protein LptA|nr:hypothetical protein [Prevotellaceae bacterium]